MNMEDRSPIDQLSLSLYPVADGLAENVIGSAYRVKINGKSCFVYRSEVTVGARYLSGFAEYVSFDFAGSASVQIIANDTVCTVEILPSRHNIPFVQDGNRIFFTLEKAGQYFVKINGTSRNGNTAPLPLYIFANPMEEHVPDRNDPDVIYFEPGVYSNKTYNLESGKTYYLAGGAFVYGRFFGVDVKNVKICGRGTLCGEKLTDLYDEGRTICIRNAENITIEGIHVMHPCVWTVALYQTINIYINNIKTISHGMSSDGCDICGCQNVLVENSFFRGHDDILAVKASAMIDSLPPSDYPICCKNVTFRNCVAWCDSSNPMTIGYETAGDVGNITFENIDVLNQSQPPVWRLEAIMAIEPHGSGTVDGVVFRNIRVDVALPNCPAKSLFRFCVDSGTGTIRNVLVENVLVNYGGSIGGRILGLDTALPIASVTFRNVRNSAGRMLCTEDILINERVRDIIVDPPSFPPVDEETDVFEINLDYLELQGFHNWYYRTRDMDTGAIRLMLREDTEWRWPGGDHCFIQHGYLHCDQSGDPLLTWRAPRSGMVHVSGVVVRAGGGGDGTRVYVLRNAEDVLWQLIIPDSNRDANPMEFTVAVCTGDTLDFGANQIETPDCDGVNWAPVIRYITPD